MSLALYLVRIIITSWRDCNSLLIKNIHFFRHKKVYIQNSTGLLSIRIINLEKKHNMRFSIF